MTKRFHLKKVVKITVQVASHSELICLKVNGPKQSGFPFSWGREHSFNVPVNQVFLSSYGFSFWSKEHIVELYFTLGKRRMFKVSVGSDTS